MSFTFRGKTLDVPFYCLTYGKDIYGNFREDIIEHRGERFNFHQSTLDKFNLNKNQDLCHRYSFSSMASLLCSIYNAKSYYQIGQIFDAMYPDKDTNPDYSDALNVYYKIDGKGIKNTEMLQCFNELLYIFNNALINLRPGDSSWNRSIGGCYDPESWYHDKDRFVINSKEDVHILDNLLKIFVNPSTIYFYTAQTHSGELLLYSSNNSFPYEGIKAYGECTIPIFISSSDGVKQIT